MRNLKKLWLIIFLLVPVLLLGQKVNNSNKSSNPVDSLIFIDDAENYVYFPGGNSAFHNFFKRNLKFADSIKQSVNNGTVLVSFQIDTIGKVANVRIVHGLSKTIDLEIIRVISLMPNWEWDRRLDFKRRKNCIKTLPIKIEMPIKH